MKLGEIGAERAQQLAESLLSFGEDSIRFTLDQNILVRNVPGHRLAEAREIAAAFGSAGSLQDGLVSCAGADTCKLGICLSRKLSEAIFRRLESEEISLGAGEKPHIHISGCPIPAASIG